MLRSVARRLSKKKIPGARLGEVAAQVTYFENNACRMDYPGHMEKGWPIGSGPVEAACKTIVKARMCQSGMRWSREGGKNILALRVLHRSDQWDSAWDHYLATRWQDAA